MKKRGAAPQQQPSCSVPPLAALRTCSCTSASQHVCHPQTFRCAAPSGLAPTWRWHHRSAGCKRARLEKPPMREEGPVTPGPRQSRMIVLQPEADLSGLHAPGTHGASDFLTDRGGALRAVWAANHGTLPRTGLTSRPPPESGQAPVKTHGPLPPAAILLFNKCNQRPTM